VDVVLGVWILVCSCGLKGVKQSRILVLVFSIIASGFCLLNAVESIVHALSWYVLI
jgi:hypothetical protein